ncbi:MAG TPA: hypothetical protein PK733_16390 [Clostridiales bacterium]|nr:hypothetical protein [Clostridiales bacterium]
MPVCRSWGSHREHELRGTVLSIMEYGGLSPFNMENCPPYFALDYAGLSPVFALDYAGLSPVFALDYAGLSPISF